MQAGKQTTPVGWVLDFWLEGLGNRNAIGLLSLCFQGLNKHTPEPMTLRRCSILFSRISGNAHLVGE